MNDRKLVLKRMGVINITPNSFSDHHSSAEEIKSTLKRLGKIDALDIGAESTAPQNQAITWQEEWQRWQMILPMLPNFKFTISADTYHPETIFELTKIWKDQKMIQDLFWNDVSGKFDHHVKDFLKEGKRFHYVYCHNRAPKRELTSKHMDYVKEDGHIEEELRDFFGPHKQDRVIFDPCLGFSKSYDENWFILNHFGKLQKMMKQDEWLLGFSRKSFIRKKFNLTLEEDKDQLDKVHQEVLKKTLEKAAGRVWVRTHRPELL